MAVLKANDKYRATLRATFIDGVDTTLAVTAIPTNLPTLVTIGWNTAFQVVFEVTGTSGTNASNYALTGITKIKGFTGNLPENLAVNCLNHEEFFNQYATAIIDQEGLADILYAEDAGSTDTYAITLAVVPASYAILTGVPIAFLANTVNTGPATININGLGAKTIKKNVADDLETNDIQENQIVIVIYDGTNFQLVSNIRAGKRTVSVTSSATPTPNADITDDYVITALAAAAAFGIPTGTPRNGQVLVIRIKDNGTARALTYNAIYRAIGVTLPPTTIVNKTLYIGCKYNSADIKWDVIATAQEA